MRQVIRADLTLVPDPLADLGEGVPAPLPRRAGTSRNSRESPGNAQPFRRRRAVPAWARASGRAGRAIPCSSPAPASRCSTPICAATRPPPGRCAPAWRFRAPRPPPRSCASTPTKARCATCASPSATTPAPRRSCFSCGATSPAGRPASTPGRLAAAAARARPGLPDPNGLAASLKACAGQGDPVSAAAKAAALAFSAFPDAPAADAEILALWAFDLVLALRLRWPRPLPLIATKILDPESEVGRGGRRPRPGEPGLGEHRRRARSRSPPPRPSTSPPILPAAPTPSSPSRPNCAPNRRPKIVDLLLAQDCVSPAEAARHAPMTDRAARRLFDRLVALGAAREFSGRPDVPAVRPMSAAARRRRRSGDESLDVDLLDLPPAARWREWMLRVEAAIFASAKTRAARGARPPGRRRLPVRRSDRRPHPRAARPPLRPHPRRRRLCAAHQNPLRAGDPRRPSRTGRGRRRGADQDRDLCADGDCLFAAGHAGGRFRDWRGGRSAATSSPPSSAMA